MLEVNAQDLSSAIARVAPACDPASPHTPYKGIHFDSPKAGLVRLTGTDGIVYVETTIEASGKWQPFAMSAKDANAKVRGFPANVVKLDVAKRGIKVTGEGTARTHTLPIFDVEQLAKDKPKKAIASINVAALQEALSAVRYSVGLDSDRPGYGMHFVIAGDVARFEATNGHTLAVAEVPATGAIDVVLPPKFGSVISSIVTDGNIDLSVDGNHIVFSAGKHCVRVLRLDTTFPPFAQIIDSLGKPTVTAEFLRDAAREAIKACDMGNSAKTQAGVKLTVGECKLDVSSEADGSESNDSVEAQTTGSGVALVNAGYMLGAIGSVACDMVHIEWSDQMQPIVVRPAVNNGLTMMSLVMPMRL